MKNIMRRLFNYIKRTKFNEKITNLSVYLNFSYGIKDALSIFRRNMKIGYSLRKKSSFYYLRIFLNKTLIISKKVRTYNRYILKESTFKVNCSRNFKFFFLKNVKKRLHNKLKINQIIKSNLIRYKVIIT